MTLRYTSLTKKHVKDFWAQVDKGEPCWTWRGSFDSQKKPVFFVKGRSVMAYRIAWCLEHDIQLPSHHRVQRTCETLNCVYPGHLRRVRRGTPMSAKNGKELPINIIRPPGGGEKAVAYSSTGQWGRARQQTEMLAIKSTLGVVVSAIHQLAGKKDHALAEIASMSAELKMVRRELHLDMAKVLSALDACSVKMNEPLEAPAAEEKGPPDPVEAMPQCTGSLDVGLSSEPDMDSTKEPEAAPEERQEERQEEAKQGQQEAKEMTEEPADPLQEILAGAFSQLMGGSVSIDRDHEALRVVFDLALREAEGVSDAVAHFDQWLGMFHHQTSKDPVAGRSAEDFQRAVSRGQLAS